MTEQLIDILSRIRSQRDPDFALIENEFVPWGPWHPAAEAAKVAMVSTGAVYLKHGLHQPFAAGGDPSFREFPHLVAMTDLATASDSLHARADLNVIFPLERLHQLAEAGYIGAVAPLAYSFGSHAPQPISLLSNFAPSVAYRMKRMGADVALVVAVGEPEHQAAALIARAIELAGVPTVLLGTCRPLLEAVKPPRTVLVQHPQGAPLGNPGNAGKHQQLLRDALQAAWAFEGPGLIAELPYSWNGK